MIPPRLAERLAGGRGVPFSDYVDHVLYDEHEGFYATGGRAGGRGDFLTSPEVGPLFGAVLARALDQWWDDLGRPDPFVVVEVGAGPGTLARTVRVAAPRCAASLAYVLVERSAAQRAGHREHLPGWVGELDGSELDRLVTDPLLGRGPVFASAAVPPGRVTGVIVANELLDNLPFDVVRRHGTAAERMTVTAVGDDLALDVEPTPPAVAEVLEGLSVPDGAWVPWVGEARRWLDDVLGRLVAGRVLVVDYGAPTATLAGRPDLGWLRTFRGHAAGGHPLDAPGGQDITTDVPLDQLTLDHPAALVTDQAGWLHAWGLAELVEEGRRLWAERAHAPDLDALRARSRVREAEALTDPDGLGAFVVVEWEREPGPPG